MVLALGAIGAEEEGARFSVQSPWKGVKTSFVLEPRLRGGEGRGKGGQRRDVLLPGSRVEPKKGREDSMLVIGCGKRGEDHRESIFF